MQVYSDLHTYSDCVDTSVQKVDTDYTSELLVIYSLIFYLLLLSRQVWSVG